ncbi:MAG: dUTP diphosphatase [Candidatus Diapherotrites archaeon]|nr:dUTP diphosphatase [Candidatus Diapherotrites archaeon]
MTFLRVKKLVQEAIVPHYVHPGDSGMDLYSVEEAVLLPGERKLVSTGLSIAVEKGFEAQVRPKSGLAANFGITVLNTPGTIDSGYRGEVKVILFNSSKQEYKISKASKIAQLVIAKVEEAKIQEVEELDETVRGEGGFGSTGLKKHS